MSRDLAMRIAQTLRAKRFDLDGEKACQAQIEDHLRATLPGFEVEREYALSAEDRPDFFVRGVVIEVKMNKARPTEIVRQLRRYALHAQVSSLILATNRAVALPGVIAGKPVVNVSLGRGWL